MFRWEVSRWIVASLTGAVCAIVATHRLIEANDYWLPGIIGGFCGFFSSLAGHNIVEGIVAAICSAPLMFIITSHGILGEIFIALSAGLSTGAISSGIFREFVEDTFNKNW